MITILKKKGMVLSEAKKHSFALDIYFEYFYNINRDRSGSKHRVIDLGRLSSCLAFFYTIVTLKPIDSATLNMRLFQWYVFFIGGYYDYMWN